MVLQEYQHDNHGMIVTNMFQTSWTGAAKVPHMFRNFMGTGAARVPACCSTASSSFLLFGAPVLQSATPYYRVLLQYYCVLLCTRKNYSSTTLSLYYKGLLQYYSVLQSTIPVLLCTTSTTPVLLCTTKYVRVPVTTPPCSCTLYILYTCPNLW